MPVMEYNAMVGIAAAIPGSSILHTDASKGLMIIKYPNEEHYYQARDRLRNAFPVGSRYVECL
jgi:hypothetical protein